MEFWIYIFYTLELARYRCIHKYILLYLYKIVAIRVEDILNKALKCVFKLLFYNSSRCHALFVQVVFPNIFPGLNEILKILYIKALNVPVGYLTWFQNKIIKLIETLSNSSNIKFVWIVLLRCKTNIKTKAYSNSCVKDKM